MRRSWEAAFVIVVAAVVVTHHVTSYVLVVFLVVICLVHWRLHGRQGAPWVLAAGAVVLTLLWLGSPRAAPSATSVRFSPTRSTR